jgi:hypothetical protein
MDIHKPKPWHGVREFLKEYVIIVVGVLTALAAEQGVEWLHWRFKVAQTEAVLLPEVQFNLLSGYDRIITARCQVQRLTALRDQLLKPGPDWKGMPLPMRLADPAKADLATWARTSAAPGGAAMPPMYAAPGRPWREGVWSAAVANGVLDHMDRARAATYARLYRGFEQMREEQQRENSAEGRLYALGLDRTLSEAEKTEFLNALGELNSANVRMASYAAQMILDGDANGLRIKASDAKASLDQAARGSKASCYVRLKIPLAAG